MNKKVNKKLLLGLTIGIGAVLALTGCTQNFCNDLDFASMAYPYEQGVTVYCNETEYNTYKAAYPELIASEESANIAGKALSGNEEIYKYVPYTVADSDRGYPVYTYKANKARFINDITAAAYKNGVVVPSVKYFAAIDDFVLRATVYQAATGQKYTSIKDLKLDSMSTSTLNLYNTFVSSKLKVLASNTKAEDIAYTEGIYYINPYIEADTKGGKDVAQIKERYSLLKEYGWIKFSGYKDKFFDFYNQFTNYMVDRQVEITIDNQTEVVKDVPMAIDVKVDDAPYLNSDFYTTYKSNVSGKVTANRSCIATRDDYFGHYGLSADWEVHITQKDIGYAYGKGLLEGLLIFPVSWMVDTFAYSIDPALSGVGQIWAIVLVTLIVRVALIALTFKQTMSQQKMQALAPELAKIQAKYPNANTNQAEKARLSQEQMALYKRNKINPIGSLLVMVIQFPVFICVWAGLQGSAALSTGSIWNMRLSDTIREIVFNTTGTWYQNTDGWWTALILFILMAATQIMAMLLPRIIQKIQAKKVPQLSKNPAQDKQNKQMKWISIGLMGFTIVMGFLLPSAMGVYWLIGGIISMIQTGVTQLLIARKKSKK